MRVSDLSSPARLIDRDALDRNLRNMQACCDEAGVELWPHIKTHKLVPVLRRQLELGAKGATCAKVGEAEALLPSGVRQVFIAHSLVDLRLAPRLRALAGQLDRLILAVTSRGQFEALNRLLADAEIEVSVLMAVNTGLDREGVRGADEAKEVAALIRGSSRMELIGIYTHEGHAYGVGSPEEAAAVAGEVHEKLLEYLAAVGGDLPMWPGCSVTAAIMVGKPSVAVVRPGSYVFADLSLVESTRVVPREDAALTILATVIDLPEPGMALIDAGSKVFSGDRSQAGLLGRCVEDPEITVVKVSEEHGFLNGEGVAKLAIGQRLRFVPAHVCPVVNLAPEVHLVDGEEILETWVVDARGRSD